MCNLHWCYTFCTGVTLFALVLHLNCTALSQSESSNVFMCIIRGSYTNKHGFLALESLHCRAAKLIYGLTRDMPTTEVLKTAKWDSLHFMYKVKLAT